MNRDPSSGKGDASGTRATAPAPRQSTRATTATLDLPPTPEPTVLLKSHHIRRIVADLAAAELAALRTESDDAASVGASASDPSIDDTPTSVDLLAVASAVDRMFHLTESGREDALLGAPSIASWSEVVYEGLSEAGPVISFPAPDGRGVSPVVTYRLADLEALARHFVQAIPRRRRVLSLVPAHRPYGFLWAVLFPAVAGVECLDARAWTTGQVQARARGGDLVVAPPERWASVDAQVLWAADVVGVTSSGPCSADAAMRQRAAGLARLVDVYGCASCVAIGWRDDHDGPFILLDRWKRFDADDSWRFADSEAMPDLLPVGDGEPIRLPDRVVWEGRTRFRLAGIDARTDMPASVRDSPRRERSRR